MKVLAVCAICARESAEAFRSAGEQRVITPLVGEMHDTGVVFVTCAMGHNTATLHLRRKHEILFESGVSALLDGYATEAVSTMSAALECCYEFFARVACRHLGVAPPAIDRTWKLVAAQSERQFGAFAFLYQILSGDTFEVPSSLPKFRNKVIHRGYMPSTPEARKYAEEVFTLIRSTMRKLDELCRDAFWREMDHLQEEQRKAVPSGMEHMLTASVSFDLCAEGTFETWLEGVAEMRGHSA